MTHERRDKPNKDRESHPSGCDARLYQDPNRSKHQPRPVSNRQVGSPGIEEANFAGWNRRTSALTLCDIGPKGCGFTTIMAFQMCCGQATGTFMFMALDKHGEDLKNMFAAASTSSFAFLPIEIGIEHDKWDEINADHL